VRTAKGKERGAERAFLFEDEFLGEEEGSSGKRKGERSRSRERKESSTQRRKGLGSLGKGKRGTTTYPLGKGEIDAD